MTEIEKVIELFKSNEERKSASAYVRAKHIAVKCMEKQIPKKWEYICINDCDVYACPCCNECWFTEYGSPSDNKYNYCPNCGQLLECENKGE